jgi:hypothetical protein
MDSTFFLFSNLSGVMDARGKGARDGSEGMGMGNFLAAF